MPKRHGKNENQWYEALGSMKLQTKSMDLKWETFSFLSEYF